MGALLFILIGLPFLFIASYLINGYVLSTLWFWFIVPTFGLPALSIPAAIGICMIVAYLTNHSILNKSEDTKTKKEQTAYLLKVCLYFTVYPALVLGIGSIVQGYM